jgi:4-amino-4-deoxychorismate lyase
MAISVLINGVPQDRISIHDRGFQYGDGLFETVAVVQGRPLLWERHMERLQRDASRLGIAAPSAQLLAEEAGRLCQGVPRGVLKITCTRGVSGRGYAATPAAEPTRVLSLSPWPEYSPGAAEQGVAARFCRARLGYHPALAGIKHLNRLEQVLARAEWVDEFAEGLMQDEAGQVIEGTMSNLFIVSQGTLHTPELTACGVSGVIRGLVLERAPVIAACRVGPLTRTQVLDAEEIFLTNSVIGLWPVTKLETREYSIGPITRKIRQALQAAHAIG